MLTFRCDDGSIHEVCGLRGADYPEGEIGTFRDDEGVERQGVRLVVGFDGALKTGGLAGVSTQVRRWDPDVKKHTKEGRAVFDGKRDLEDFIARKRDRGEDWGIE